MAVFVFFTSHWFGSLFFQTFFLHRYASHKMFQVNKFWERVFYLGTFITQGSSYLVPRAYALMHRMHHAFSDTKDDPHSPHFFEDVMQMMLNTRSIYNDLVANRIEHLRGVKDALGNYPRWDWLDKFGDSIWTRIAWAVGYIVFYAFFATQWWMYLLLPIHFMMGPIHGAIVNWCGHKYGYQNYKDTNDHSRNSSPWDILMLGELFQNNHHKFPNSPKFSKKWFEFDPVYPIMRLMDVMKIIKLRKKE